MGARHEGAGNGVCVGARHGGAGNGARVGAGHGGAGDGAREGAGRGAALGREGARRGRASGGWGRAGGREIGRRSAGRLDGRRESASRRRIDPLHRPGGRVGRGLDRGGQGAGGLGIAGTRDRCRWNRARHGGAGLVDLRLGFLDRGRGRPSGPVAPHSWSFLICTRQPSARSRCRCHKVPVILGSDPNPPGHSPALRPVLHPLRPHFLQSATRKAGEPLMGRSPPAHDPLPR